VIIQRKILLVTNDESTIDVLGYAAERTGCEVKVYRESIEALRSLYRNPWQCNLFILDEDMPDVPGSFIADRLLKLREGARVILLVPGTDISPGTQDRTTGVGCIMVKPSPSEAKSIFLSTLVDLD